LARRNGLPKPNASDRTWRRYRERNNISTGEDDRHFRSLEIIKDRAREAFARMFKLKAGKLTKERAHPIARKVK